MPLRLVAIKPRRQVLRVEGAAVKVDRELRDFHADFIKAMATYPPQRPGTRYRRRGSAGYGGGWRLGNVSTGSIESINRISYAVYVGGPKRGSKGERQAEAMRKRGWPNLTDTADRIWRGHRRVIITILEGKR